ncbi:FbpB family small basic protein [Oceanobacillus halophilus]|uniref:FbpB family small basic protein n=1 Tax=Oceanobacillus halophilus TaxID=930130 RepID=A0A495AC60_9BACI|nr:FbpB family small basic protein [Oceanobacillus halophilus]
MSLKKKLTFEELVQENRKQILEDRALMDKIDQKLEQKFKEAR